MLRGNGHGQEVLEDKRHIDRQSKYMDGQHEKYEYIARTAECKRGDTWELTFYQEMAPYDDGVVSIIVLQLHFNVNTYGFIQ